MHQTKKGNQWYFGMKAHIGVDSAERTIHAVAATPANVHDSQMIGGLRHGGEPPDQVRGAGDSAYQGRKEAIEAAAPGAQDMTNRRGSRNHPLTDKDRAKNRTKSKVRARVEHPFPIIKRVFGFVCVRYRGIGPRMPTGCMSPVPSPICTSSAVP